MLPSGSLSVTHRPTGMSEPTVKGTKRTWGIFLQRVLDPSPHARVGIPMGRRVLAKSVSDEWPPETLHDVMSVMAATWLSFKGHCCPSCTPHRERRLLDSRVVEVPMAYDPTFVKLSSLKPCFLKSLKEALCFSAHAGAYDSGIQEEHPSFSS